MIKVLIKEYVKTTAVVVVTIITTGVTLAVIGRQINKVKERGNENE